MDIKDLKEGMVLMSCSPHNSCLIKVLKPIMDYNSQDYWADNPYIYSIDIINLKSGDTVHRDFWVNTTWDRSEFGILLKYSVEVEANNWDKVIKLHSVYMSGVKAIYEQLKARYNDRQ